MEVAILTVGDELLAGETTNTNASWLAAEITGRGASVRRICTVPDDRRVIADAVADFHGRYDAVVVTGGLGDTPDDVTMVAVADALDREFVVNERARERLVEKIDQLRTDRPELFEEHDLELDPASSARLPDGARPLVTDAGWAPGCVVASIYVFAGIPEEMRAAFDRVADDFGGDAVSRTVYTPVPEGALTGLLADADDRFDVTVASHPRPGADPGRVKVAGTDPETVDEAMAWLEDRLETVDPPDEAR
ncbi:competence/damage-inducible protein A [Halovivax cerinus]|uniref:Competence/damage-inducible protein A n=1 Tax=Halovivax cerinus TaxID=1487865 RepID=A0ABD5NN52_9EURY|nr:molybdopterin-binding protein [Halovivax cerinus]